jgi:hypothetical protein
MTLRRSRSSFIISMSANGMPFISYSITLSED